MKKIYIVIIVLICFLISLFSLSYYLNPLVQKNKLNLPGFLHLQKVSLYRDSEYLYFFGLYAYMASENEPKIEEYAYSLIKEASDLGSVEADCFLGISEIFLKNNEKKGLEYLEKAFKNNKEYTSYYLALYYFLKVKDNEKGLSYLKLSKNFMHNLKDLNLDEPVDYENIISFLEKAKEDEFKKEDLSVEFAF